MKMTDYVRGYNEGIAGAALSNIRDNGDKISGYSYTYKTDGAGVPYIHIDCVRAMLKTSQLAKCGRWITNKRSPHEPQKIFVCSECGALIELPHYAFECYYDYCPRCGAKMEGGDGNE